MCLCCDFVVRECDVALLCDRTGRNRRTKVMVVHIANLARSFLSSSVLPELVVVPSFITTSLSLVESALKIASLKLKTRLKHEP